jgi:fructokinase
MNRRKIIVGLGEVLWDLYPGEKHLGGAPANAAIHVQRLGEQGLIASAVGQDVLGDEIIGRLKGQGIGTRHIQRSATQPTGTVRVKLDEKGVPHFRCSRNTAFDHLRWNDDLEKLSSEADAVIVGTLAQRNEQSRHTIQQFIKKATGTIVFDVNFREWNEGIGQIVRDTMIHTDILKLNETELQTMKTAFAFQEESIFTFFTGMMDNYPLKSIALSLGEKGCLLTDGNETILSPGIKIDPVDTTGCGDAFTAGIVHKYLKNASLNETAEFANQLGAFVATMKGAAPRYTIIDFRKFQEEAHDRFPFQL